MLNTNGEILLSNHTYITRESQSQAMGIEIWQDIPGYEGMYLVSTLGNVKSVDRKVKNNKGYSIRKGRNIKVRLDSFGYLDTRLCKNGKKKSAYLHRIIAETYIPNPENKPFVNHKNGIKTDNRVSNLEWTTASGNSIHAISTGLRKLPHLSSRSVVDICTNQVYPSMRQAAKANNINYGECKNLLKGIKKNTTCLRLVESEVKRESACKALSLLTIRLNIYESVRIFNVGRLVAG